MKLGGIKIGVGVVVALAIGVLLCVILDWRPWDFGSEVGRSIGAFATRDEAVSASLKRLSRVIRTHPNTRQFRIYFDLSQRDQYGGGGATLYVRKYKQIGYENDPPSGFVIYWTNVDDTAIHAVAATNGTFASLGKEAWRSVTFAR